ncbi:MAG: ATPase, T2SS/T4P/T4SS family [Pirellulales bacterium]
MSITSNTADGEPAAFRRQPRSQRAAWRPLQFNVLAFLCVALGCAASAWAQGAVPVITLPAQGWRGPGFNISLVKLGLVLGLFLVWVYTTDWISQDCDKHRFKYALWNPLNTFTFAGFLLLFFVLPNFAIGFPLLFLAWAGPFGAYVVMRNGQLEMHERVLTPAHLRYVLAKTVNKIGIPMEAEMKDPHEKGKAVKLLARGGATDRDDNVNLLTARQSPGFVLVSDLIVEALDGRGDAVLFDVTPELVNVKFQIDGVWHDSEPQARETGDLMIAVLKQLCNLKPDERVKPQRGQFAAEYKGTKMHGRLQSQGTQGGERVVAQFDLVGFRFKTLDELGMRTKTQEQLKELLQRQAGFVIFSSPPAGGLTVTVDTVLRSIDRYTRNFSTVDEEKTKERDIENLHLTTYSAANKESPASVLPKLVRTYPDVLVVRDPVNAESLEILCEQPGENRVVVTTTRAKEAAEAILRVMAMKPPGKEVAEVVTGAVGQRLIRKLCETCKEAYAPPPELLKQMGIQPGRLEAVYRPPAAPERVCPDCNGVGFVGRTALYELLVVDDAVRKALLQTPKIEHVRLAARKAGMRTLQEEGLVLVAKGITSVPELVRVLKQ